MAEKSSKGREMHALSDEMHDAICRLAGPRDVFDSRERWLERAARRAGISPRRAKAFFYREASAPRVQDVEAVRTAVEKHLPAGAGTDAEITELAGLVSRLEAVADRLDRHAPGRFGSRHDQFEGTGALGTGWFESPRAES